MQCNPVVITSATQITAGTTTFVSSTNNSPTGNTMLRFTVGSTASMRPGYTLRWTGGVAIVGVVVSGTVVEIVATTGNVTLPGAGNTITVTFPGANLQLSGTVQLKGTGNTLEFQDVSLGFFGATARNLRIGALNVTLTRAVFHNQDATAVGSNILFDGALEISGSGSFLGYTYGTAGSAVLDQHITFQITGVLNVTLIQVLFDHCQITTFDSAPSRFEQIIVNRASQVISIARAGLYINMAHLFNFSMDNTGAATNVSNALRVIDNGLCTLINTLFDGTSPINPITSSLVSVGRGSSFYTVNTSLAAGDINVLIMNDTSNVNLSTNTGATGVITPAITYTVSNASNASPTITAFDTSRIGISTLAGSTRPLTITNTGTATTVFAARDCLLSVFGGGATEVVSLLTAGASAVSLSRTCTMSIERATVNGSTAEYLVNGASKLSIAVVTNGGAGMVDVGTLGVIAIPAAGNVVVDAAAVGASAAGDGSIFSVIA